MIANDLWAPSAVEQYVYDILDGYDEGIDIYKHEVVDKIAEYLNSLPSPFQFQYSCEDWPNMQGGCYTLAFVDNDKLHMVGFNYVY